MKNFWAGVLIFSLLLFNGSVCSQTTGDCRTAVTSVDWSNSSHWQIWDGSKWASSSTAPDATNSIFIQAGHTVTISGNQACLDLYISSGTSNATTGGDGLLALQNNTVTLDGKLSCYIGAVNTTLNSTSALSLTAENNTPTLPISKSSGGKLKFIGNGRNLTLVNEWGGNASGSVSLFDVEVALNSGQTGILNTIVKAANWVISSGILSSAYRIAVDNNTVGQGDLTINVGATLSSSESGGSTPVISRTTNSICGSITINGKLQLEGISPHIECASYSIGTEGTVEYNRTGNQSFIGSSFSSAVNLLNYKHIILSGTGTKTTQASLNTELIDNGSLKMKGANLALGSSATFSVSATGTTLEYSGSSAQTASSVEWLTNFQNIIIDNSSGVSIGGLSRTINGTLTLSSGSFSNGSTLTMGNGASITRTGGGLNSAPNFGSTINVNYNQYASSISTGNEIPTDPSVLSNLTINSSNGLILSNNTSVNGILSLSNGIISTSSSNLLTIETSGSVTGSGNSSFISGPIAKKTSSTSSFTFPIGKGNVIRALTIVPSNSNATTYTAEYFNAAYSNISSFSSPITRVSSLDYFELTRSVSGSPANAVVSFAWGSNSGVNSANVGELSIARYNGSTWENESATGSGNASSGVITSNSALSTFGIFALANASTNTNPLPISWLYFKSIPINRCLLLEWATASELNNFGFEVQRSINGSKFDSIGFVSSMSDGGSSYQKLFYTFLDLHPLSGISFYRLKQMDFDTKYEYSSMIKVEHLPEILWRIDKQSMFITNGLKYVSLKIVNTQGQTIIHQGISMEGIIEIRPLTPGMYYLIIDTLKPIKFCISIE